MEFIFFNFADNFISCRRIKRSERGSDLLVPPTGSISTTVPSSGWYTRHVFQLQDGFSRSDKRNDKDLDESNSILIKFRANSARVPRELPVPSQSSWRVYITKVDKKTSRILIIPRRNMASFLSDFPDDALLSSFILPGTHQSLALHGALISQCQDVSTPLAVQLQSGIRVLDIRLSIIDSRLIAYHGIYPERALFQNVLSTIHSFLTHPSTSHESLVMSIKQEDVSVNSALNFSRLVHDEILHGPGGKAMWYLRNRIPSLGEVRGKVILFSRFGGNGDGWDDGLEGIGIHPSTWPDSKKEGFSWQCKDILVRTHDWYDIPSMLAVPEKFSRATKILPVINSPDTHLTSSLSITYLSASSFPFATPRMVAKGIGWCGVGLGMEGINSRFSRFLLDCLTQGTKQSTDEKHLGTESSDGYPSSNISGWVFLDFYTKPNFDMVPLLVEYNYRRSSKGTPGR